MTPEIIKAIESILAKGDRVEVIPGAKGTIKVLRVRRDVVYQPENPAKMVKAPKL